MTRWFDLLTFGVSYPKNLKNQDKIDWRGFLKNKNKINWNWFSINNNDRVVDFFKK